MPVVVIVTVFVADALQPFSVTVKVMTVEPALKPVTSPLAETVATAIFELDQVVEPVVDEPVSCKGVLKQVVLPPDTEGVGKGLTVTVAVEVAVQPKASVAVTL